MEGARVNTGARGSIADSHPLLVTFQRSDQDGQSHAILRPASSSLCFNEALKSEDMERSVVEGQRLGVLDQVVVRRMGIDLAEDVELRVPHGKVQMPFSKQSLPCRRQASICQIEPMIRALPQ